MKKINFLRIFDAKPYKHSSLPIRWAFCNGGGVQIDPPITEQFASCPDCGSRNGVINIGWAAWCCLEPVHDQSVADRYHKIRDIEEPDWKTKESNWDKPRAKDTAPTNYMNLPKNLLLASLDKCHQNDKILAILYSYVTDDEPFILLSGRAGTGKTYSACSILNEYQKKKRSDAKFLNISDLYLDWKNAIIESKNENALMQKYKNLEILVLDDLGQRTPTDSFMDFLYVIINSRNANSLKTIFTTNLNSDQMFTKFGEAVTSRILSGKIIKFEGSDKRLKNNKGATI